MILSLNEVTAMARKAARGAGYDWATADEAARATRALCEAGVDGCAVLASLLDHPRAAAARAARPVIDGTIWHGQGAPLCPLRAGAALSDRVGLGALDDAPVMLRDVIAPGLLLAYAGAIARRLDRPVALWLDDGSPLDATAAPIPGPVTVMLAPGDGRPMATPPATRAQPAPAAWTRLCALAHLTYAPATEASRRKGAGGDLPDTD